MRRMAAAALALLGAALPLASAADSDTLYATSVRTYSDPQYKGIEGNIYRVDPASAATTLVAPLRLERGINIGLDGLAIHPKSGVFYGITAPSASVSPHSLVKVDPATGSATLIGNLKVAASDIAFGRDGTLFTWVPETRQVGRVDLDNGAVTLLGKAGPPSAAKGGLVVISAQEALIAASGAKGRLDHIDLATGAITRGVELKGARYAAFINGMAQSRKGVLFAVNTDGGTPALADLVTIDRQSGQITTIGPLPNDTDALDFGAADESAARWGLEQWRMVAMGALILAVLVVLVTASRARKTPR